MKAVKKNKATCRMPRGLGKVQVSVSKGLWGTSLRIWCLSTNLDRGEKNGERASWQLLSSLGWVEGWSQRKAGSEPSLRLILAEAEALALSARQVQVAWAFSYYDRWFSGFIWERWRGRRRPQSLW